MCVAERGDDHGFLGLGRFNLVYTLDVYEAAIDAVATAKEGVNSVSCVDFVGCDDVLCEGLNDTSVREGADCSECLHRAGPPTILV